MARFHACIGSACVLALLIWGGPFHLYAQQKGEEPVNSIGNDVQPPRITHQVSPEHPANGFRITGSVLVGLIVSSKGEPKDVHVVRSLDKSVDQSAVDAVKQWQFDPATKDGKPVAVRINVEIRFHDM